MKFLILSDASTLISIITILGAAIGGIISFIGAWLSNRFSANIAIKKESDDNTLIIKNISREDAINLIKELGNEKNLESSRDIVLKNKDGETIIDMKSDNKSEP